MQKMRRVRFGAILAASALALTVGAVPARAAARSPAGPWPSCTIGDLRVLIDLQGAVGSRVGSIRFTNFGDQTCTLEGRPGIKFVDSQGAVPLHLAKTLAWWKVNAKPKPQGWPLTTLKPGDQAIVRTGWSNWCRPDQNPVWKISVPGSAGHVNTGYDGDGPPVCHDPSQPTRVEIGPFEPSADE